MPQAIKLSDLVGEIDAVVFNRFYGKTFWVKAEITDVKKQPDKRWCFLKFIEKDKNAITTEIKGVFWSNTYSQIELFEKNTRQVFASGLEITCCVQVRFHKRFGIDLEVLEIDSAYTIGKLELERKETLDRLTSEKIAVLLSNGTYATRNNRLELPTIIQKIASVTAPNSDGQRDFKEVVLNNKYGYVYKIDEYLTQIQGDSAANLIIGKLKEIATGHMQYDAVVIARGGGSDTDFKAFNDFELAKWIANYPIPVLTGIGHDRNTSIADLMARQFKTPTEVGKFVVESSFNFDMHLQDLKDNLEKVVDGILDNARRKLDMLKIRIKAASPDAILNRGFAMVKINSRIITDPALIETGMETETYLKSTIIKSVVTQKIENGSTN